MGNTMISARVPAAKKERASSILASIGATASDLVNSALDYVIETKQLPGVEKGCTPSAADFASFVATSTVDVAWPADAAGDYKSFMRRERLADYDSLA